jgi:hypothetical protein
MSEEFEVIHGTGNVFRDLGRPNADAEHLKAVLAAQIIKVLDAREMTVREAEDVTGRTPVCSPRPEAGCVRLARAFARSSARCL